MTVAPERPRSTGLDDSSQDGPERGGNLRDDQDQQHTVQEQDTALQRGDQGADSMTQPGTVVGAFRIHRSGILFSRCPTGRLKKDPKKT
jgi:hypothetical protein